jgi:hypothetical protein
MRTLISFLVAVVILNSCKPKSKIPSLKDLVTTDSSKSDSKESEEKNKASAKELIVGKWKVIEMVPTPSESEKDEILNSILEFTNDGRLMFTSKGKTEQVATINFSFDNKYLLSHGDHDEEDTMLIQELNRERLVLSSTRDNKTLVAVSLK